MSKEPQNSHQLEADAVADGKAGKLQDALHKYEKVLSIKKGSGGAQSTEYTQTCVAMCHLANLHSINLLRLGELNEALYWLKKGEELCENNQRC